MSKRTLVATAVLAVWAGALAWHVKREYFPSRAVQLTRAARRLPPGPAYYRLAWRGRRLGWARVLIDTVPGGGFRLRSLLEVGAGALGLPGSLRAETSTRLGPDLRLERFSVRGEGGLLSGLPGADPSAGPGTESPGGGARRDDGLRAEGRVVSGDSVLVGWVERAGRRDSFRASTGGDLVPLGALPLRLAADPRTAPGRRVGVRLLDPRTMSARRAELRVVEEARRSYVDSARRDPSAERWRPATRDTVRAWKVERRVAGVPVAAWVDEDGRLLEATVGSSLRLERTAFELAYFEVDSGGAAAPPGPPAGAPGTDTLAGDRAGEADSRAREEP